MEVGKRWRFLVELRFKSRKKNFRKNMIRILFDRVIIDTNIIYIDNIYSVKKTVQRLININLENSRCISQSKRYYHVFPESVSRAKRNFLLVSLLDTNSVVCVPKIEFCINF